MNKSKKEIENTIAAYFHGIEHAAKVSMNGTLADVDLSYIDFKPSRQVRRELEDLIPNMVHCEIYREYSVDVSCEALEQVCSEHPTIYVKDECTGEYKETNIGILLDEVLFDKSFVVQKA